MNVNEAAAGRNRVEHQLNEMAAEWPRIAYDTVPWVDLFRLERALEVEQGVELTGLIMKWDGEGWFVIIKGEKKGQAVVHFTGGHTWSDALEVIGWEVGHRATHWRPDKYPKKK